MTSLTLTLLGPDRPGLVETLSEAIVAAEGNWLESRMARLGGQFAGILLAEVPEAGVDGLAAALRALEEQGLHVVVERSAGEAAAMPSLAPQLLQLELVGHDRPGIVHEIAQALAERRVNIEELTTRVVSGSFSGDPLFQATARLRVPTGVTADSLRDVLEPLANELMVDITLEPQDEGGAA